MKGEIRKGRDTVKAIEKDTIREGREIWGKEAKVGGAVAKDCCEPEKEENVNR